MNSLELFIFAFLLQVVSQIILFVSWLFPISVTMRPALLDDMGVKRRSIVYLTNFRFDLCFFLQEMPACAIDDAYFPEYDRHIVHCILGSVSSNSNNSMLPTSWITFFDSGLKWVICLILSQILLKSVSIWAVLNFLNQFLNAGTLRMHHNRMW